MTGVPVSPVLVAQDRSMLVPEGHIVRTDYVAIEDIKLACRERMGVGDINLAYQKRLQLGGNSAWPCPRGHWSGSSFVIEDGRHEYVACLMLGHSHMLVAWIDSKEN